MSSVLIVDDNEADRVYTQIQLQRVRPSLVVHPVATVPDALRLASEVEPALILLDYHLPPDTAEDFLACYHGGSPVVILAGSAETEQITKTLARGSQLYLPKPLSLPETGALLDSMGL